MIQARMTKRPALTVRDLRWPFSLLGAFCIALGAFQLLQGRVVGRGRYSADYAAVVEGPHARVFAGGVILVGVALLGAWWSRPRQFAAHAAVCLALIPFIWAAVVFLP